MPNLIIHTNPHLNSEASLLQNIAQSVASSSNLEGIDISIEETLKIAKEIYATFQKEKK